MSFRLKTVLGIGLIQALLLAVLISGTLQTLRESGERELLQRAVTSVRLFAASATPAVVATDLAQLDELARQALTNPGIVYARVRDRDGRLLAGAGEPPLLQRPFKDDRDLASVSDDGIFDTAAEIEIAGIRYGRAEIGVDIGPLRETARAALQHSLAAGGSQMALVALFSLLLGTYLTRQLRALTAGTIAIGEGRLGHQIPVRGSDELAGAARAFNAMSRRLAEEQLRRDAIFDSALDGILTLDADGRVVELNGAAERITGYTRTALCGRLLTALPLLPRDVAARLLSNPSGRLEVNARAADGRPLPLELGIGGADLGSGRFVTLFLRDIGERRARDDALRKLQRAVEQQFASVVITDTEGTIEYVNAAFEQVTGYGRDEAIGQNPRILKSGTTPHEVYSELWDTITRGEVWRGELVNRRRNGELFAESVAIAPVRDERGAITHFVAVKEDITEQKQVQADLRAERDFSARIIAESPALVMGLDPLGHVTFLNPAAERLLTGPGTPDPIGLPLQQLLRSDDARLAPPLLAATPGGEGIELTLETQDRVERTLMFTLAARSDAGGAGGLLLFGYDISGRKAAEQVLHEEREFLQRVIDGVAEPIMVLGADHSILLMNSAARAIAPQIAGQPSLHCYQLSHGRDAPCTGDDHPCPLQGVLETREPVRVVHEHLLVDGSLRQYELLASPVWGRDGSLRGIVEASRDITEHVQLTRELQSQRTHMQHLAHHDALTGLPNRLLFTDRLERAIRHAERDHKSFALLFIDLDRFKHINDSLGHAVGDQVLTTAAQRIRSQVRASDTVARLGGDEFVVIAQGIEQPDRAGVLAQKVLEEMQRKLSIDGHDLYMTISIGICLYPQDGDSPETLLRNADSAMYNAKEAGRNNFAYYASEMTEQAFQRVLLESSLRRAIEEEQLTLHYQPQYALADHSLVGVEALLRWHHPKLGQISPATFIPLAEETGLILPLGRWVLRTACAQLVAWRTAGVPIPRVAVNLSGRELQQEAIAQEVGAVLRETGCPPEALELEVTETMVMKEIERSMRSLKRLRELGVQISVDDFGTGYSSLNYLKLLPLTKLKIDRSFVAQVPNDANDVGIATAIVALARSLGLAVLAEGVETEAQRDFLNSLGCDEAQGWLFARALPGEEIAALFQRQPDAPGALCD